MRVLNVNGVLNGADDTPLPSTKASEAAIVRLLSHTAPAKRPAVSPALPAVLQLRPTRPCRRAVLRLGACVTKPLLPTQAEANEQFFAHSKAVWDAGEFPKTRAEPNQATHRPPPWAGVAEPAEEAPRELELIELAALLELPLDKPRELIGELVREASLKSNS